MSSKKKILLVEDDANLGFMLQENLELRGYEVVLRVNGEEGLRAYGKGDIDLCLVDVMLPKKDGFTFAKEVRERDQATPIIFLTAKALKEDRIAGFNVGCDDYVTKPFSMEELALRIQAVLRRASASPESSGSIAEPDSYRIGRYRFDYRRQVLEFGGKERRLTGKESDLLRLLARHSDRTLAREEALKSIWGEDSYFNGRSMDVFIARLRRYLRNDSSVEIVNVHGRGFRLVCPKD